MSTIDQVKDQFNMDHNDETTDPDDSRRSILIRDVKSKKQQTSLADFKILDKVGSGSFGAVYAVSKEGVVDKNGNPKIFAMKTLDKGNILEGNLARYTLTERNVLGIAGHHPLIVGLEYAFQTDYRLYLVMEFCPGGDLKDQRRRRLLPEDEARMYIAEIILAIEHLHKNNIIYRDLKPDNVVLTEDGHTRLTDFGLSKENVALFDQSKSFVGSYAYLGPEIIKRQPHTRSIDWYLIGVLLYELIVGEPPYYNHNREILFTNILSGPLKIPQAMSTDARDLILALLHRNPKRRLGAGPNDADELK